MGTFVNSLGGGGGGGGSSDIMIIFSVSDEPGDGQVIIIPIADGITITIPSGMTGSKGFCNVVPTANVDFSVYKNTSSVGTISFALGANAATFVAASDIVLEGENSDYLKIVCPVPQDATFADIGITLKGTRS